MRVLWPSRLCGFKSRLQQKKRLKYSGVFFYHILKQTNRHKIMKRIRLYDIRLHVDHSEKDFRKKILDASQLQEQDIEDIALVKKSADLRKKGKPFFVYCVDISLKNETDIAPEKLYQEKAKETLTPGTSKMNYRPIIVGTGPSGLFAALWLTNYGYRPIIIEQGKKIEERRIDIKNFIQNRTFHSQSNYVFGEGGAGAYSDGKLGTGISSPKVKNVLNLLVSFGAPPEIAYTSPPHIGSDRLRGVIIKLRKYMISQGADFFFGHKVTELDKNAKGVFSIVTQKKIFYSDIILWATGGHSTETFHVLQRANIQMQPKPFQMGVRIEHPQTFINKRLLGSYCEHKTLTPVSYKLLSKRAEEYKQVSTFCMCPGGEIIPGTGTAGFLVTNGMSNYKMDSPFANSALVVTIYPKELSSNDPLAGIYYRENIEKKAFELGGANYHVPAQRAKDYLKDTISSTSLPSSYKLGTKSVNISLLFDKAINNALKNSLKQFDKKIKDYISQGVILAPETRSSCPVKIVRDKKTLESLSCNNFYPIGEGAGYAGGIMSAAVDGIKAAEKIITKYSPVE